MPLPVLLGDNAKVLDDAIAYKIRSFEDGHYRLRARCRHDLTRGTQGYREDRHNNREVRVLHTVTYLTGDRVVPGGWPILALRTITALVRVPHPSRCPRFAPRCWALTWAVLSGPQRYRSMNAW